ncbi:MAG: PIG-L family deacetylase [Pseudobacteriovorax sp.]|nr:PIG-L family deacetylase [Pseudobacteriovorax sp.]
MRLSHRIKQWGADRLLKATYRVTQRMPLEVVQPPPGAKWLVIAPHNDDEVIGAGGLLSRLPGIPSSLCVLFVTGNEDADADQDTKTRWQESEQVRQIVGFKSQHLAFDDGAVERRADELSRVLASKIKEYPPDFIITPFPTDHHRDHQAVGVAVGQALSQVDYQGEIWCYEIWSTIWPNMLLDISDVWEKKKQLIETYQSQVCALPYGEAILGLNRYRGLKAGIDYAEAYYRCRSKQYQKITNAMTRL